MYERCVVVDLGRRDYQETWLLQKKLVQRRKAQEIPDTLLFVEHPPTFTLGRNGNRDNLLVSQERLAEMGARFVQTDRGGDITFHGPGQVVGYPVLDLKLWRRDVHLYLRQLEEVMIRTLASFGIAAHREDGLTGVWHASGKLAAIGVRLSQWISSHGFALNVATDLENFNRIIPCGIVGRGVSSMENVLGASVSLERVRETLVGEFGDCFERLMEPASERRIAG